MKQPLANYHQAIKTENLNHSNIILRTVSDLLQSSLELHHSVEGIKLFKKQINLFSYYHFT